MYFFPFFPVAAPKIARVNREEVNTEKLLAIPGIHHVGALHKSCAPVQLTESETEYTVSCIKHCFAHHIVFQVKPILFAFSNDRN